MTARLAPVANAYDRAVDKGLRFATCSACSFPRPLRDFCGYLENRRHVCKWCAQKGVQTSQDLRKLGLR